VRLGPRRTLAVLQDVRQNKDCEIVPLGSATTDIPPKSLLLLPGFSPHASHRLRKPDERRNGKELGAFSIQTVPLDSGAARAIETFRSDIAERVNPADELGLRQYRRRYKIYRAKREKAEKEAKKEIKEVRELKLNEIKAYLARYYKDGKDQRFRRRQARYSKAKNVLRKLADTPHLGKSGFLQFYSELVGGGGDHRLWTSSGLARSKSEVASHYPKVMSLVRLIAKVRPNRRKPYSGLGRSRSEPFRALA
jgi:hypothetical protein